MLRQQAFSGVSEQFTYVAKRKLIVGRFDHGGLHQLQNSFVADEDLCGRNVLLST